MMHFRAMKCAAFGSVLVLAIGTVGGQEPPDIFSIDASRFRKQLTSPSPEVRVGGVQGLSYLRHFSFEADLVRSLSDPDAAVRREAALALGRSGRSGSVLPLIGCLDDGSYETAAQATLALQRVTSHKPPAGKESDSAYWRQWWKRMTPEQREASLLDSLKAPARRGAALSGLTRLGGARTEAALVQLVQTTQLSATDVKLLLEALEPLATERSLPVLRKYGGRSRAVAWALGNIGGQEAEGMLVAHVSAYGFDGLMNLDRLRWKGAFAMSPRMIRSFGLVSYRSQPDDLHVPPTPVQRTMAQLLVRSGRADEIVDIILSKLDGQPSTIAGSDDPTVKSLRQIVDEMDPELKPGFHRADGYAKSIPLCAMSLLVRDQAWAPRLIKLLDHPAYVVRVYAARALGQLRAEAAVEPIARILRDGYPFDDAIQQDSGKHGAQISRFVRWKGYLAMSLGSIGSDRAREVLQRLVVDSRAPRDIRLGAAVGLGRIADERSRDALATASKQDIIRWVRRTARRSLHEIDLAKQSLQP